MWVCACWTTVSELLRCQKRHGTTAACALQRVLLDICGAVTETGQRALLLAGGNLPWRNCAVERNVIHVCSGTEQRSYLLQVICLSL
jgi:hypothetical protein